MHKNALTIFTFIPLIFIFNSAFPQISVGIVQQKTITKNTSSFNLPVEQWVGKKFIFLEKHKSLQNFGYTLFLTKNLPASCKPSILETPITCFLMYKNFVGKIIEAVEVDKKDSDYTVTFVEEKSGRKIYAKTYKGYVDGIALFNDIENAKNRWMGKTIYSKIRSIKTYSDDSGEYGKIDIKIGEPLKVIDVLWGISSNEPLWMVVENQKNEKGFLSTSFSWTNIYRDRWSEKNPWEYLFFEINPKEKFKWSDEIWDMINNKQVVIGMNNEQVELSWGIPEKLNKDIYLNNVHEQWVYGSQYLYFENNVLVSIQNH